MSAIAYKRSEMNASVDWAGEEERAFLALAAIKGIGHKTLSAIAEAGKSFADILYVEETDRAVNLLRSFGARVDGSLGVGWETVRKQASDRAARLIDAFSKGKTTLIFRNHKAFPHALHDLANPPHWLFVKGSLDALHRPALTIVGTREPSDDGGFLARYVGACLPNWGAATVSGLASGIDQYIHEYSLRFKVPTIAILGTGILSDYPRGALDLKERIVASGGALVTEYLPIRLASARSSASITRGCFGCSTVELLQNCTAIGPSLKPLLAPAKAIHAVRSKSAGGDREGRGALQACSTLGRSSRRRHQRDRDGRCYVG
jgi:hypothetical protein